MTPLRNGEIAALGDDLAAPDGVEVVDAEGLTLLPSFVDPHVHLRTPGQEHEEDIASGTSAAAAGGFGIRPEAPAVNSDADLRSPRGA